jgi:hypothetical protein
VSSYWRLVTAENVDVKLYTRVYLHDRLDSAGRVSCLMRWVYKMILVASATFISSGNHISVLVGILIYDRT